MRRATVLSLVLFPALAAWAARASESPPATGEQASAEATPSPPEEMVRSPEEPSTAEAKISESPAVTSGDSAEIQKLFPLGIEPETTSVSTRSPAASVQYAMAGNFVRQGRSKDALRLYMSALESDPGFVEAMNDAALIYKEFRDWDKGETLFKKAISIRPEGAELYHNFGELHQEHGFALLRDLDLNAGMDEVRLAIQCYGKAVELAEAQGRLAARAPSYFRLGEICYYANTDPEGARAYWERVLNLHAPTPDILSTREVYYRDTAQHTRLETWQRWAAQYLKQLDAMLVSGEPRPVPVQGPAPVLGRPLMEAAPRAAEEVPEAEEPASPGEAGTAPSKTSPRPRERPGFWPWERHR
ncbi:MAG: tetratricopeptide repeat protein [Planctomycetota bacterium]